MISRIILPFVVLALAGAAVAQCGECDPVPGSTITDALAAAQHGVGLSQVDPGQFDSCDVNSSGFIDVLDSLWIAKRNVGLTQAYDCVLDPNQAPTVSCLFPLGGEMLGPLTELAINLTAADGDGDDVDFEVLYSLDWGFSWTPCTWTPGSGSGLGVTVPPGGTPVDLTWDVTADIGAGPTPILDAKLCITVTDGITQSPLLLVDYFYFNIP